MQQLAGFDFMFFAITVPDDLLRETMNVFGKDE